MNATNLEEELGTRAERKARAGPPWNVVLHNSWHPMSWAVYALVRAIPNTSVKRAT